MIKKALIFTLAAMSFSVTYGQKKKKKGGSEIKIPMEQAYWENMTDNVEFFTHRSVPAVRGKDGEGYAILLKDTDFADGTIEYDVEFTGTGFPGINFRVGKDRLNAENFYIRSFGPVSPLLRTTLQYATVIDGNSMWDLTDEYQAGATINQEGWNHVKLVVSGRQMKVYVNDMQKAAMHVPCLEGTVDNGGIVLTGNVIYANMIIRPNATEGLAAEAGYDPTYNDSRYLRNWSVTEPVDFPFGKDVGMDMSYLLGVKSNSDLPDSTAVWTPIRSERRAIVNLSRPFGLTKPGERRLVWLKTSITSDSIQERRINMGFSDEVWVYINGQLLLTDKNYFGTPSMKHPRGRCTIENTSFKLPLKEGDNELLIGVANFFYGWGVVVRLDKTDGLRFN